MPKLNQNDLVAVLGAGTMGRGIAQVAATYGHPVLLIDTFADAVQNARASHTKIFERLVEKGRLQADEAASIQGRISYQENLDGIESAGLVIEAIVEILEAKTELFSRIESLVSEDCVLASNTSSLSIAAISGACEQPQRFIGLHFFNPAPLMPLVEVVPGIATEQGLADEMKSLMQDWGKLPVIAKDTPGFIVNRVARPFYGEALRILEEGIADAATIDWAMREIGGFRMGPFQLMDFIGNDINYAVTESVFAAFFYDPRFKPSFTQKRMVEAKFLGKKSGRGYYEYTEGATAPQANEDRELGQAIVDRVVAMLINEAVDAVFLNIASRDDVELAMTRGVNYPRGLLRWADDLGLPVVLERLEVLQDEYGEDRYRPNPLLKRMVRRGETFFT